MILVGVVLLLPRGLVPTLMAWHDRRAADDAVRARSGGTRRRRAAPPETP